MVGEVVSGFWLEIIYNMSIVMTMDISNYTRTIKASEFKAKCLELMDEVARTGTPLVITKHGRPVAQLGPVVTRPASLAGAHRGQISIKGDIVAPLDEPWEALR